MAVQSAEVHRILDQLVEFVASYTSALPLQSSICPYSISLQPCVNPPPPPHNDSPRFVVQWVAGLNTRKRHFMGGNSSADILQCHSGLAPHAFVLFVNRSALSSCGKVCCLFEPGVRIDSTDLGGSQQALIAERHPHLLTDDKLCTLCVHYLKPCPFFAKTSPRITLPATPESLAQSTTAVTPAKNKPD